MDQGDASSRRPTVAIIRQIYGPANVNETFELQLEKALSKFVDTIVIEPFKLGDETACWISVGNCLHNTSVLAGIWSIISAFVLPDEPFIFVPATILSSICTGLYSLNWKCDPCVKYQTETSKTFLEQLALGPLNNPVVLVRKDDKNRKILHTAITIACISQTLLICFPYMHNMHLWFGRAGINHVSEPSSSSRSMSVSNNNSFMRRVFGDGLKYL